MFSEHSSVLSSNYYPPIELESNSQYGLGLHGFYSYNSIFNVDETNNIIGFKLKSKSPTTFIQLPPGAYEIDKMNKVIQNILESIIKRQMKDDNFNIDKYFTLRANNNTLKCEIVSKYDTDFTHRYSFASIIGFENKLYSANISHESTLPVNIMKVRILRVDCNIISGAYMNGQEAHTLYEFDIDVEPGYKLSKEPQNIIYMPVRPEGRQFIDNITLRILDDDGNLVDFHGEKIIVKLELKKLY
jgi:hypothetical protein